MALNMNAAFLNSLGWSLVHSLWQAGICWLLYLAITQNGRKFSAAIRHDLAVILKLIVLVFSGINFFGEIRYSEVFQNNLLNSWMELEEMPVLLNSINAALPWIVVLYLTSITLLLLRFYSQYRYTEKLKTTDLIRVPAGLKVFIEKNKVILGISKSVELWLSPTIEAPLTIGFWKPIILIPVAALNQLSTEQTEAIILHELQHIRRNDYLINLIITITDILFFFNPFNRLLSTAIHRERENNCDDLVLQFRHHPENYATALLILEKSRGTAWRSLALEATGNTSYLLLQRIKRLLTGKNEGIRASYKLVSIYMLVMLIVLSGIFLKPAANKASMAWTADTYFIQQQMPSAPLKHKATSTTPSLKSYTNADQLIDQNNEFYQPESLASSDVTEYMVPKNGMAITDEMIRDYSLLIPTPTDKELAEKKKALNSLLPFVPANSFSYRYINDTMSPILSDSIAALAKIEAEKSKSLLTKLALKQEELEKKLATISKELREKQDYQAQVQKYNEAIQLREQRQQLAEQMILQEHFEQNEILRKAQRKKLSDSLRIKPIVIL